MNYPRLQFTCEGGPLDGCFKTGFAMPNPAVHRNTSETIDIGKVLESPAYAVTIFKTIDGRQVAGHGRYKITLDEGAQTYRAVHVPSDDDVPFPTVAPFAPTTPLPPNTLGL